MAIFGGMPWWGVALVSVPVLYLAIVIGILIFLVVYCPRGVKTLPQVKAKDWEEQFQLKRAPAYVEFAQKHGKTHCIADWGIVHTCEPDLVKELLMNPNNTRRSRVYKLSGIVFRQAGLLVIDGPQWKHHTRTLLPVFQPSNVAPYSRVMHAALIRHVEAWISNSGPGSTKGGGADFLEAIRSMLMDVLMVWGFGLEAGSKLAQELSPVLRDATAILHESGNFGLFLLRVPLLHLRAQWHLRKARNVLAPYLEDIKAGRAPKKGDCPTEISFISQMVAAKFSASELAMEVLHIYGAHKAAGLVMMGMLFNLTRTKSRSTADSPWVAKLRAEFDEVIPKGEIPTRADVPKLEVFSRVLDESLRMLPVTLLSVRRTGMELKAANGAIIPADSEVGITLYALHHDPDNWDDPMTFNPDRFLKPPKPYTFVPFLLGKRMCAGMPFAKFEMAVMMHALLTNYDLEVPIDEFRLMPAPYTAPDGPLPFIFHRRPGVSQPVQ